MYYKCVILLFSSLLYTRHYIILKNIFSLQGERRKVFSWAKKNKKEKEEEKKAYYQSRYKSIWNIKVCNINDSNSFVYKNSYIKKK